jgi:signal transduction histidine kinase
VNKTWRAPAITTGVVVGALLIASAFGSWRAIGLRAALPAAVGTACAAVAASFWVRYRSSADPNALFVAAGFSVLALQILALAVVWPAVSTNGTDGVGFLGRLAVTRASALGPSALGVYATQIGWVVAGACFVLAKPWWERRGRPAVRPWLVIAGAGAAALLLDGVVAVLDPAALVSGSARRPALAAVDLPPRVGLGPAGAVLLVAALLLLGAAVARELQPSNEAPPDRTWLAASFTVAAIGLLVTFTRPLPFQASLRAVDLLPVVAPILALVGMLASQREEVTFMRRASDRAEEVLGGRAEIASMVAHEVRGPVSTIRGLASTGDLQWDRLPDAERREFFRLIDQESVRLLRVADQVATALKVDAGTLNYVLRPTDLGEGVREGIDRARTGDHPLAVDLEEGTEVLLDRVRFAEAVTQLVDNAAAFSPPDAPIEVRARVEEGSAVVEVVDHGPGIRPDRREAVFGKFPEFRPPGYEEVPGTGLGLFICRGLVRAQGGDVMAMEAPDGGTMLRITLPTQGDKGHGR